MRPEHEKKICYLYKQKMSLRDIADVIKMSHETVRTILNKYSLVRKHKLRILTKQQANKYLKRYRTYKDAAEAAGVSVGWLYEVINGRKPRKPERKRKRMRH
jgi:DNA-binding LacI/PurR family transcriptional regulator